MNENVVNLADHLEVVGEGYRFDADEILEAAKRHGFDTLVILGEKPDGEIYVAANANAGESLILIERAKASIIFPD